MDMLDFIDYFMDEACYNQGSNLKGNVIFQYEGLIY